MHTLHPELTTALAAMVEKLCGYLPPRDDSNALVCMYLAGGMAMHYHCGVRYTEDVDATFSERLLFPAQELTVDYCRADGTPSVLYFDANYNDGFALMHPDYRERAQEWPGIGKADWRIQLFVLTPLDLAVSKLSRYSPQDREDILTLSKRELITSRALRQHAAEALDYYVGDTSWLLHYLDDVCEEMET